jgi:hypothetical protein
MPAKPDNTTANDPTAAAVARLQDAQTQYMAALQDAWSVVLESYNATMADYLKAQQDLLKGGTCAPQPKSK